MKRNLYSLIICAILTSGSTVSAFVDDVRWLAENQHYDLILNPETIPAMTGYPFETYFYGDEQRLIISDRDDGLWRVNADLVLFQSASAEEAMSQLPGDHHTLSFDKARNILIEGLDIYAHEVEEALKFSSCTNVVVRNCRVIASRTSEDAIDIVRGQNYIFDRVRIVGLGEREMTVKGSARYIDIIESQFGLKYLDDFYYVFKSQEVTIGDRTYLMGNELLPLKTIPGWAMVCLLFSGDRSLGLELGGWSDYDIGYINEDGQLESRPSTSDIRIDAEFTDPMNGECDRNSDLIPVLQWHTAERAVASKWIFNPTNNSIFGDLVEDLYYENSQPSNEEEAELRERLGSELDYWNVELPRYAIEPQAYSNNRFFGALYNFDNHYLYSPLLGWFYVFNDGPIGHDFMQTGTWIYHYPTAAWFVFLQGEGIPSARWWNPSESAYYHGALERD